ncbi:MAG: PadR family transcriptional regulator [Actinobacteria bacterium]|nr:PadR family transcriptional regulator [Actinomycetota bacterium]
MPIHHAVLALLDEGDSYGYELRAQFRQLVGPQWGDLNIGHLYQVLERLVRDGLVTKREVEQERRPDKVVYRISRTGRQELEEWLETPFVRSGGYRDDFFLKLAAASRLGRSQLKRVLRAQREAYLAELAALTQLRTEHRDDPLVSLLVEAAILHTEANLKVLDRAETSAAKLAPPHAQARAKTTRRRATG